MTTSPALTLAEAQRIVREAMRDKSYQQLAMGGYAAAFLRGKRKRLTDASYRDYESSLDKFCRYFLDLDLADFEPPVGRERVEEYLDHQYGGLAPGTYNKQLSILHTFFEWHIVRGDLHGDPTLGIEKARKDEVYRTTFSHDDIRAIIASQDDVRDRIACHLLLDYGLRKGALKSVKFRHFDHWRKRLTIFSKGGTVRQIPLPDPMFWMELEQHVLEAQATPDHFLMCRQRITPRAGWTRFPDKPMGDHGLHNWWYRCLERGGVVAMGTTSGERMHKARHTAGQRVLDATGNLKAVQKLLGHASIQTTGDVYADWDIDQLATTMARVLEAETDDR